MNQAHLRHSAIAVLIPVLLGACGGSDPVAVAEDQFVGKIASAKPGTRLAASNKRPLAADISIALTAADLFNWAEGQYPELFPKGPQNFPLTDGGINYTVRAYPNGNYLGEANGIVYGLGDFTNGQIQSFGRMVDYTCQVFPAACNPPPLPTAALNECIDPAAALLPTGFRVNLVLDFSGPITGEQTVESVIDGPDLFEGVSAVRVTTTTTGSNTIDVGGFALTSTTRTTSKSYEQASASGRPWKTLGSTTDVLTTTGGIVVGGITVPGSTSTSSSKTVHTPADENLEFTLQVGQSLTKAVTSTTTVTAPVPLPPTTATSSEMYTFETKESITVFGKTYNTCRYKMNTVGEAETTTTWMILGKGIPVKTVGTAQGVVQTIQVKSGTYNGSPI